MEDYYRIHICRGKLVDSEIPLLERVIANYFGISGERFNSAFSGEETVSFESEISVDIVQECVFTLEEQGFKVHAEKIKRPEHDNKKRVFSANLDNPKSLHSLTYDDCQVLFSKPAPGLSKLAEYKNWIAFGCTAAVLSAYFLMVYSAFS